jgi:hypothetical protein
MPNQTGGAGRQPTKNHVKQYLKARGIDPSDLGNQTYAALNSLSPQELKVLDTVGAGLDADGAPKEMRAAIVH